MFNTVFVPGYGNSINGHWQETWFKETPNSYWVEQKDWQNPICDDWVEALNLLIQSLEGPIVLVTHSLGGSTLVEWNKKYKANMQHYIELANAKDVAYMRDNLKDFYGVQLVRQL